MQIRNSPASHRSLGRSPRAGGCPLPDASRPHRHCPRRQSQSFLANRTSLRRAFEAPAAPALILVDAGPLVALIDADDHHHARCVATLQTIREPLATGWPAVTEPMD